MLGYKPLTTAYCSRRLNDAEKNYSVREGVPGATAGRQVINAAPPPEGGGRARAAGEGDDAGWEVELAKLAAYKAAHGHCNVPRGWPEDQPALRVSARADIARTDSTNACLDRNHRQQLIAADG